MNPFRRAFAPVARIARAIGGAVRSFTRRLPLGRGAGAIAGATAAGVVVTPETALALTPVFAAINTLATDYASLTLGVIQETPDGRSRDAKELKVHELLSVSPDGIRSAFRFRQALMGHALGRGNGYAEIERDSDGFPIKLHLLDPISTRPVERSNGEIVYQVAHGPDLRAEDVIHVAGFGFDGITGYNPALVCADAIALGKAAEVFGASFYGNGTQLSGFIKHKGRLSDKAAKNLRDSLEDEHSGPYKSHRLAILEEGMEFTTTGVPPEASQFLETRKFQVVEIARLWRLPPHKIGDFSQAHLANLEESNIDYFQTGLAGWCAAVEGEYNLKLLTSEQRAQGFKIEHDMRSLMRGNMVARSQHYEVMERIGAMSPNEIRRRERMDPVDGGDVLFVPLNMTTLENAGKPAPEKMRRESDNA